MSITAEQFYEAMGKIRPDLPNKVKQFVASAARLGVEANFEGALNLRWKRSAGPSINFGVVDRNGQIWTETVHAHAPPGVAHRYIEELAAAFSMQAEKKAFKGSWQVRDSDHAPRIEDVADKLDLWITVIEHSIASMKKKYAE